MLRLKELREARGVSMKETARNLNIPYTTYVNYEKGLREPNSETLISIAKFYGCSIDYLLGFVEDPAKKVSGIFKRAAVSEKMNRMGPKTKLSCRIQSDLYDILVDLADKNGRTLEEEIEERLYWDVWNEIEEHEFQK